MTREEVLSRAVSPRVSTDPPFERDVIGVALFGRAQQEVVGRQQALVADDRRTTEVPFTRNRGGMQRIEPTTRSTPMLFGGKRTGETPPPPSPNSQVQPPTEQIASPLTASRPVTDVDFGAVLRALPDTEPSLDDFTRNGTLPGFGDANQDPFGANLRRRLTVLLRSS